MNTQEFKAWFEGFTEGLEGEPSKKQWARIKGRVKEIDSIGFTSHTVFVDRYRWGGPNNQYYPGIYTTCLNASGGLTYTGTGEQGFNFTADNGIPRYDSLSAFSALGKNDSMECASV